LGAFLRIHGWHANHVLSKERGGQKGTNKLTKQGVDKHVNKGNYVPNTWRTQENEGSLVVPLLLLLLSLVVPFLSFSIFLRHVRLTQFVFIYGLWLARPGFLFLRGAESCIMMQIIECVALGIYYYVNNNGIYNPRYVIIPCTGCQLPNNATRQRKRMTSPKLGIKNMETKGGAQDS